MQNDRHAVFTATLLVIAALALVLTRAYQYLHQPASAANNKPLLTHTVLAVDFNNDPLINQKKLADGKDAVLTIIAIKDNAANNNLFFNSVDALARLDQNKDGRIDSKDPIYPRLQLLFLQDHQQKKFVPLAQAGIKAIVLNKSKIVTHNKAVGYVVMKDDTTRTIQLVDIRIPQNN